MLITVANLNHNTNSSRDLTDPTYTRHITALSAMHLYPALYSLPH